MIRLSAMVVTVGKPFTEPSAGLVIESVGGRTGWMGTTGVLDVSLGAFVVSMRALVVSAADLDVSIGTDEVGPTALLASQPRLALVSSSAHCWW
ncbi:MAG: hypothetical protein IPN71_00755 [Fibrobacteres bacterium]|nr:hypothetical protein [Fibrobacterota bacterium]